MMPPRMAQKRVGEVALNYSKVSVKAGLLLAVGAMLVATGCEQTKETLGLARKPPDEFTVVSRAPLSVPPGIELQPPQPGAVRPQEGTTQDVAKTVTFGLQPTTPTVTNDQGKPLSPGEQALLVSAGAANIDPDIRSKVDAETASMVAANTRIVDSMLGLDVPQGALLDADKEAARIRRNQALGIPVDSGDIPIIERRRTGMLEGLF